MNLVYYYINNKKGDKCDITVVHCEFALDPTLLS